MKENNLFKPVGKRLDNLNNLIQTKYPQDKWVLEPILPIFLSIIDSSSTIEQQQVVTRELNKVFDLYEFRYNIILENKIKMTQEQLRMQFLSGVITESEYKTKLEELNTPSETKDSLNENFVGMGAINNPFADRKKETYEDAFEHFLSQKYTLTEEMEEEDDEDYSDYFFDVDTPEDEIEEGKEVEEPSLYEEELEESEKPGTAKERSAMAKKARAGKDIGEKGKNFEKIAKAAAKKYGSKEAGKKVAGAVMYGKLNK